MTYKMTPSATGTVRCQKGWRPWFRKGRWVAQIVMSDGVSHQLLVNRKSKAWDWVFLMEDADDEARRYGCYEVG